MGTGVACRLRVRRDRAERQGLERAGGKLLELVDVHAETQVLAGHSWPGSGLGLGLGLGFGFGYVRDSPPDPTKPTPPAAAKATQVVVRVAVAMAEGSSGGGDEGGGGEGGGGAGGACAGGGGAGSGGDAPAPATAAASRPPAHPPMGASTTGARTPRRWQNLVVRRVGGAMSVRVPWARDGDGSWAPTRRKHAVFARGGGDRDETFRREGYKLPSTARGARRDTDGPPCTAARALSALSDGVRSRERWALLLEVEQLQRRAVPERREVASELVVT
eukprot:scaffold13341_cov65-Phaeocystis_antarctica.AAC.3